MRHGHGIKPEDDDKYGQTEKGEPLHTCDTRRTGQGEGVKLVLCTQVIRGGDKATLQF